MRLRPALLALAIVWLLGTGVALADAPQLRWRAPSGCPDKESVAAAIARATEPETESPVHQVDARISATRAGFAMELALETEQGVHEKELTAKLCQTFVELLLLELGFAALPGEPLPPAPKPKPAPIVWGLRGSAQVGNGPLPAPSPGIALAAFLTHRRLHVEAGASYGFPRVVRYPETAQIGARFQQAGGELRACYVQPARKVSLPLCLGSQLGALIGTGLWTEHTRSAARLWASVFFAPAFHYPIVGRLSGWAEVSGELLLVRPTFGVKNLPALYRPDPWLVRGVLGLMVALD